MGEIFSTAGEGGKEGGRARAEREEERWRAQEDGKGCEAEGLPRSHTKFSGAVVTTLYQYQGGAWATACKLNEAAKGRGRGTLRQTHV